MAIRSLRSSTASPLLYQYFRFEKGTQIVHTLVWHSDLCRFGAFIASRRIEVEAVAASVQIRTAVLALLCYMDLIHYLDFRSAVVAAGYQVKLRLNLSPGPLRTRRRFWFLLTVTFVIAALTILPGHFPP